MAQLGRGAFSKHLQESRVVKAAISVFISLSKDHKVTFSYGGLISETEPLRECNTLGCKLGICEIKKFVLCFCVHVGHFKGDPWRYLPYLPVKTASSV